MIDFWEAIGRLATYKHFNDEFLGKLPSTGQLPTVDGHTPLSKSPVPGLKIPEKLYTEVQNFIAPNLSEEYLSVASAGELIWTYSYQISRTVIQELHEILHKVGPEIYGPSTRYFITLGAVLVDDNFFQSLRADKNNKVFRRMAAVQSEKLAKLFINPEFLDAAKRVSALWNCNCGVLADIRPSYLYTMPVVKDPCPTSPQQPSNHNVHAEPVGRY